MKLEYGPNEEIGSEMFVTYCDADHGGNKDNGKSTTGYIYGQTWVGGCCLAQ